jgi:predicted HTH domain antitoxin
MQKQTWLMSKEASASRFTQPNMWGMVCYIHTIANKGAYAYVSTCDIDVPETSFPILRTTPAAFAQELRLAAAVKWYEIGKISQSKAAELAESAEHTLLKALGQFKVSPYQITSEELAAEVRMSSRLWVVNASPIISLANIEHAHLLPDLCDQLIFHVLLNTRFSMARMDDPRETLDFDSWSAMGAGHRNSCAAWWRPGILVRGVKARALLELPTFGISIFG